jgi:hypothetical protein
MPKLYRYQTLVEPLPPSGSSDDTWSTWESQVSKVLNDLAEGRVISIIHLENRLIYTIEHSEKVE